MAEGTEDSVAESWSRFRFPKEELVDGGGIRTAATVWRPGTEITAVIL